VVVVDGVAAVGGGTMVVDVVAVLPAGGTIVVLPPLLPGNTVAPVATGTDVAETVGM